VSASAPAAQALPDGAWAQSAQFAFRFLFVVVGVLALAWAVSNIRRVPPESRAVILRFGNVARVQGAGLLIAWPRPIDQVVLLPSADRQIEFPIKRFSEVAAPLPMTPDAPPITATPVGQHPAFEISREARKNAAFLLAGDAGVVHLQATLFYQISDPATYVVAAQHVAPALDRLFAASAVEVAASRPLDAILVARPVEAEAAAHSDRLGREQLRADLVRVVNRRIDRLAADGAGLGVRVSRIDVAAELPAGAKSAFDRILTVTQTADQTIAKARTYAAATALAARQEAHRLVTEAEAQAEERRTQAESRVAPIEALARQMNEPAGKALLDRIYYERIGALLRKAKEVDSFDPRSGTRLMLPGPSR
jgi:regulator of protease activity HflC (stomatin/prohibitin superfamily)